MSNGGKAREREQFVPLSQIPLLAKEGRLFVRLPDGRVRKLVPIHEMGARPPEDLDKHPEKDTLQVEVGFGDMMLEDGSGAILPERDA